MICDVFWNDSEDVWLQRCSRAWARMTVGVVVQDLEVAASCSYYLSYISAIAAEPLCQRPTFLILSNRSPQ